MACCSTYTFQTFLDEFSAHHPDEFRIPVPDNVAFHKSGDLKIASNMYLFYLPPYSPELNHAELLWKHIKRNFSNRNFKDLDEISDLLSTEVQKLTPKQIINTCP